MKQPLIVLTGQLPQYSLTLIPEAEKLKSAALKAGQAIVQIKSDDDQRVAAEAVTIIKGLLDGVENTRKEVKDPVWQAGKAIDALAKTYSAELDAELTRVKRLMGGYEQEQRDKAAKAERERQEAIRKQREEEERVEALKREEERLAEEAKNAKGKEAERLAREIEEARTQRIEAELLAMDAEDTAAIAPVAPVRVDGVKFTKRYKITVTDIHALYAYNRLAVKLEPVMSVLQQMAAQGMQVPGVLFEEDFSPGVSGKSPSFAALR